MDKYKRLKHGEASFTLEERFDDVKKAANPSTEGEFVEIKISNLKIDFTKL